MARPKRKTPKVTRRRRLRASVTKSASASASAASAASAAPAIDIKSPADVKKALEIMQKFPLTVILVFANWCPHCHTYMKEWNKYKCLPNRTSPMVSVESNNSAELVKFLRGSKGEEVSVNAFPTVFVSKPSNNATNMVEPISTSDRSSMVTLLNRGSEAVSNEPASVSEDPMSVEGSNAAEDPESASSSNNYLNSSMGSMGSAEPLSEPNSDSARNASDFTESIRNNSKTATATATTTPATTTPASAGRTPFRKAKGLSNAVISAVKASTKRRRNVASASASAALSASNSILSPINNRFAKPPRKEQPYNLTMGGGGNGPSGLVKLQSGGLSPNGSLYAALRQYASGDSNVGPATRKNRK